MAFRTFCFYLEQIKFEFLNLVVWMRAISSKIEPTNEKFVSENVECFKLSMLRKLQDGKIYSIYVDSFVSFSSFKALNFKNLLCIKKLICNLDGDYLQIVYLCIR